MEMRNPAFFCCMHCACFRMNCSSMLSPSLVAKKLTHGEDSREGWPDTPG
jgi:hypothetical protein